MESIPVNHSQESAEAGRARFILERLGLTLDDLRGGKVLDVGSGDGDLGIIGTKLGIDVVSLDSDPYLAKAATLVAKAREENPSLFEVPEGQDEAEFSDSIFERYYEQVKSQPVEIPNFVQADAGKMPFPDNTFTKIVCHGFPPLWEGTPEEKRQIIQEIHRVLAKGGEARFGPILWDSEASEPSDFDSLPFPITKGPVVEEENLRWRYYSFTK